MQNLTQLPNIGKVLAQKLDAADIHTPQQLTSLGSTEAFMRIRLQDNTACLHMLYALQGAIEGIRYTQLSNETKQHLRQFHSSL